MQQNPLTQAIQELTQVNLDQSMMDTVISSAIDQQFNEVFGPSSKCTLGGFWSDEPVCINPKMLEEYIPITVDIIERLYHNLTIHDQMYRDIMPEFEKPYEPVAEPYYKIMQNALMASRHGPQRMQVGAVII